MIDLSAFAMLALSAVAVLVAYTSLRCPSTVTFDRDDWSGTGESPSHQA